MITILAMSILSIILFLASIYCVFAGIMMFIALQSFSFSDKFNIEYMIPIGIFSVGIILFFGSYVFFPFSLVTIR